MIRHKWSETELSDLESGLSWPDFSAKHPTRSYDSWEVKRRRIAGGSSGTRDRTRVSRVKAFRVAQAMRVLAEFVEEQVGAR